MIEHEPDLEKAEEIAKIIRNETYHLLTNDCIIKSLKFRRTCKKMGVRAKVVLCLGLGRAKWLNCWLTIPVIHAWGEVKRQRIETSRPLGSSGIWGIIPVNIKPVVAIHF